MNTHSSKRLTYLSDKDFEDYILPLILYLSNKIKSFLANSGHSKHFFTLGICGSVCSGKSSLSSIISKLLAKHLQLSDQEILNLSTDNFLHGYAYLEANHLLTEKGHPISYNYSRIQDFFDRVQAKESEISLPIYDHQQYDFSEEKSQSIQPKHLKVLILEGVNILQPPEYLTQLLQEKVDNLPTNIGFAPLINASIYIDASDENLKHWYLQRFFDRVKSSHKKPISFFEKFRLLSKSDLEKAALDLWNTVNQPNLDKHIKPFKKNADVCITKALNHKISSISFRPE